jgi:hypothetical protein
MTANPGSNVWQSPGSNQVSRWSAGSEIGRCDALCVLTLNRSNRIPRIEGRIRYASIFA